MCSTRQVENLPHTDGYPDIDLEKNPPPFNSNTAYVNTNPMTLQNAHSINIGLQ